MRTFVEEYTKMGCLLLAMVHLQAVQATKAIKARKEEPCVYEGHLKTKQSWFGFIANVSVINSARMTFEFIYPAHFCCQKIIFYSDDKINLVNHKLSCYQKLHLSKPEQDQILRLTPKFPWSGCHLIHQRGQSFYICEGGRSFIVEKEDSKSGTWYLAVTNCDTMYGLNLQYRICVYGQVGECKASHFSRGLNPLAPQTFPLTKPQLMNYVSDDLTRTCTYSGEVNTTSNWFGFIANTSIAHQGGFQFEFSYPLKMKTQNVILYNEKDIEMLSEILSCWQKQNLMRTKNIEEQILELKSFSSLNGCVLKNLSKHDNSMLVCKGERRYEKPQKLFMAVSNCNSEVGLVLTYHIHVHGFDGDVCSSSPPRATPNYATFFCLLLIMLIQRTRIVLFVPTYNCFFNHF